ncbi:galactan beta-1,4-galactosyltransferase GALS3-like [Telopea speciosissima]|uniref:galactan beta-1,4-galactosyltransferase GALS3-like n=1 Tax=Telopea speciosissima TaxID=54955 RepID=UPI001CC7D822|nr:galactan beta-1,4-galactosyltransferase GALS3-like [Telopea speciosissima]
MAKEKEKEKSMFVGVVWNCAAELKLMLTALLFLSSLAVLLQFIPSRFSSLSASDLRFCLSRLSTLAPPPSSSNTTNSASVPLPPPTLPLPLPPPSVKQDEVIDGGIIKRAFNPYGAAAYSFIQMGTYRGGLNTFAVIGLASKPLHVYGKPRYECRWVPEQSDNKTISTVGYQVLPDWGYGRVYTVVVVNCTFSAPVGTDGSGGRLVLLASTNGGGDRDVNATDEIEALREAPGSLNTSIFTSPPPYDYLYCGSSLYGNLSPQRTREWIAYHVKLFGKKSHFVIHDAGGVHPGVLEVLKPWIEKGYVTLQDIREQERFDGYYHNQFLIVNDCLHRYKFMAKWMFFFDVDEFIYMPPKSTIKSVLDSLSDYTQFTIEQMPMSNKLCLTADYGKTLRKWGFEKLVYKDVKRGVRRDRKYAVQPRNVYATGVHMSQNVAGKTQHKTEGRIRYFHYHGTIAQRREPCRQLVNATELTFEGTPYVLDDTMRRVAASIKRFELKTIGTRLQRTPQ